MKVNYTRPWLPEYQRQIIDSPARYTLTEAATKAGKTISHIIWQFEEVLKGQSGWNHWWVAPTIKQSEIAYKRLQRYISNRSIFDFNDTHRRIIFPNGGILQCMSAEIPDNLYGEDVYSAVYDEFTRGREESWHALRTTVTATGARVKFIGNVKGTNNWGYRLARKAEAGRKNWEYFKITADDAVRAGILPQAEIDDARDTLPQGVFLELYYGIPFVNSSNKFCFAFDETKHVGSCSFNSEYPLYLSFDFNKNPICCSVIQNYNDAIYVLRTIKLANSNIYRLCQYIKNIYEKGDYKPLYIVCGDASGRNRSAMVKDDVNYYIIIKAEMELSEGQMQQIASNPLLEDSQVIVNSILEHKTVQIDPENAQALIFDCKFVEMNAEGKIKKGDREDPTQQADALDTFKDYLWRFHRHFIKFSSREMAAAESEITD